MNSVISIVMRVALFGLMLSGLFYVVALALLDILWELFVDESHPPPKFRDGDSRPSQSMAQPMGELTEQR